MTTGMITGWGKVTVFIGLIDISHLQEGIQVNAYPSMDGGKGLTGLVKVKLDLAHFKFTEVKGRVIVRMRP